MAGKTKRGKRAPTPPVAARVTEPPPTGGEPSAEPELREALARTDAKFAGMYRRLAK
jgi:hypothetical protein